MENYEGSVVYRCFSKEEEAHDYISDYFDDVLDRCFIAIFDPSISQERMKKEIIEAVKLSIGEEEC